MAERGDSGPHEDASLFFSAGAWSLIGGILDFNWMHHWFFLELERGDSGLYDAAVAFFLQV